MGINEHTSDEHSVVLQIMLHDRYKIRSMYIIDDPRVQATFWQMQRFMQQADMPGTDRTALFLKSGRRGFLGLG